MAATSAFPNAVVYRPSVNGAGNRSNAFYLDGIINTDNRGGGWAVQPIADTIQEFKVQSHNNDAQYGNVLGAVVNVVTKSGTNQVPRLGWEFARSADFRCAQPVHRLLHLGKLPGSRPISSRARWPPARRRRRARRPSFRERRFRRSATRKTCTAAPSADPSSTNKTFFYFAYEGWQFAQPQNAYANVPTAAGTGGRLQRHGESGIGRRSELRPKPAITPSQIYQSLRRIGRQLRGAVHVRRVGQSVAAAESRRRVRPGRIRHCRRAAERRATRFPPGLIDQKLASVISAYTAPQLKNCAFTPNYTFAVDNCLDSRNKTDDREQFRHPH